LSKAPGVAEYYDVMYKHWESELKALQAQRATQKAKGATVIEIPDDDGDNLASLEDKSLKQAERGIVVEGVIYLDTDKGWKVEEIAVETGGMVSKNDTVDKTKEVDNGNTGNVADKGLATTCEKDETVGGGAKVDKGPVVESMAEPLPTLSRRLAKISIDDVLNPPGLPPYNSLPGPPVVPRGHDSPEPRLTVEDCDAKIKLLKILNLKV